MKKSGSDKLFEGVIVLLLFVLVIITLYPLYFTIIASLSDPYALSEGKVIIRPIGMNFKAYIAVFQDTRIWKGYGNSIVYTLLGTLFSLVITLSAAYSLSKKHLIGKTVFGIFFLVPMYFSGGMIPTYLQIKSLGLVNKPYTMIILGGLSIFNLVVARVYFETSIPDALYESASMEGANEFRKFFHIALPLSKSVIAVIALYYAVEKWNDYFTPLLYLNKDALMPLQIVLRSILFMNQTAYETMASFGSTVDSRVMTDYAQRALIAESMKYAMIFIASAPLMILYPFVQKHFEKGIMIGALKE